MKIEFFSKIVGGRQDGAISNGFLFSFNHQGKCTVYETKTLGCLRNDEAEVFAEFVLDKNETLVPHSNAVMFGNEYYDEKDEFPLLYTKLVKTGVITLEKLIDLMVYNPRKRFNIPVGDDFSVWDLEAEFDVDPNEFLTMGRATPLTGMHLFGRNLATVHNGKIVYKQ